MGLGAVAAVGAVGAVGSLASGVMGSNAAQSAASTQAAAADQATAATQQEQAQIRSDLSDFRNQGTLANGALDASLGLGGGGPNLLAANGINSLTFQPTQASLAATPGYQFDLNQGLQSVNSSNAARGLGVSGAALKGAANFATGLANNTLTTQAGIFQNNYANVMGPLQAMSNQGENAAAQTGQMGTQNTMNANNELMAGANATAAGTVGSANALSGGLSGLSGAGTNYLLMNNLLGGGNAGVDQGGFYT